MKISTGPAFAVVSMTAAAFVALGAGTASAGEVTGNGVLKGVQGKSECAYSGQNDGFHIAAEAHGDPVDAATRVQSYGQVHKFIPGPKGLPGYACNPSGARM